MKRLLSVLVAVVFVTGVAGFAVAQTSTTTPEKKAEGEKKMDKAAGGEKKMAAKSARGTVKSAAADSLVVAGKEKGKEAEWTFAVDPSTKIKKGGIPGLSVAILVPVVRSAAIAASGLSNFPLRTFVPGIVLGSALFLCVHFFLGFLGGTLLAVAGHALLSPTLIIVVLVLLVMVYALWVLAVRRQKAARRELESAAAVEVWHEGICPVCLGLYTANQLRPLTVEVRA